MAKGMRVAFFGASLVSGYGNGTAGYCRGLLHALAERGHRVRFYEPLVPERLARRDVLDPSWVEIVRYTADGEGLEAALEHAADADVLVKCSDVGLFDELLDAAIPQVIAPPALAVYWDMHPARTLAQLADLRHPLRAQLPWYSAVLTRYGGDPAIEAWERCGARVCFPVYPGIDPESDVPAAPDPEYAAHYTLLAERAEADAMQVRRGFFDVAATLPSRRFVLGGSGWDDTAMPANVDYAGHVYAAERRLYFCSAGAVCNLTPPGTAALGYAPGPSLVEAAGVGACVISDTWDGLEAFLEPEREVLIASDVMQVIEQLSTLSAERAATIGRRARGRCLAEHTYERRAIELEALLEGFDRQWVNKTAL
ncbi:MAG TPA: glycosyltransferase [Burkholderiales bacterium]